MNKTRNYQGYIMIITAVFTWSFPEIIVKLFQGNIGPLSLSFFRFFIGGLFLLLVLIIKRDFSGIWKMMKNNRNIILLISFFALGFSNTIFFIGITYTRANIGATIQATYSIWITVYSIFILNEKSNLKLKFSGIIIGMIGVWILMTDFNLFGLFSSEYFFGNFLVLLGSIIWSLYSVLGKKIQLIEKDTPHIAIKFSMITCLLASTPIFITLLFTPEFNSFLNYELESWFWITFLGMISTGVGLYLLFEGVNYIEVTKAFSFAFLKPIFATFLAFMIIKEEPSIALLVSIGLVVISIVLINRDARSEKDFIKKKKKENIKRR